MLAPSLAPSWGRPFPMPGLHPPPRHRPRLRRLRSRSEDVTPGPTGHPEYVTVKGGPIRFTLVGNLSLGAQGQARQLRGIATGATPTPTSSPQNVIQALQNNNTQTASASAGLTAGITRRTATTVTSISIPLTFANQGLGVRRDPKRPTRRHSTRFCTARSRSRSSGNFPPWDRRSGGVPLDLSTELTEFGDVTFFEGPAIGAEAELIHLYGVRIRDVAGRDVLRTRRNDGQRAAQIPGRGASRTLTFGAATSKGALSLIGEGSLVRADGR